MTPPGGGHFSLEAYNEVCHPPQPHDGDSYDRIHLPEACPLSGGKARVHTASHGLRQELVTRPGEEMSRLDFMAKAEAHGDSHHHRALLSSFRSENAVDSA